MWFLSKKKQKEPNIDEQLETFSNSFYVLKRRVTELEDDLKKLRGFTYRKAKVISENNESSAPDDGFNLVRELQHGVPS